MSKVSTEHYNAYVTGCNHLKATMDKTIERIKQEDYPKDASMADRKKLGEDRHKRIVEAMTNYNTECSKLAVAFGIKDQAIHDGEMIVHNPSNKRL